MTDHDSDPRNGTPAADPPGSDIGVAAELRPYIDRGESEAIDALGRRLTAEQPIPRGGFRSELHAHLRELRRSHASRPARLRTMIAAYAGSGLTLLLVAVLGVSGSGPLGY